ncbi:MAG TPA: aminomethyltransferase family protein [Pyrinomonadaceae bacterium]
MNVGQPTVINRLALEDTHARLGATFREEDGWNVPAHYGDPNSEYNAVRDGGAGLTDLSMRGRILVGGTEAIMFLNGLITNDMKTLTENQWMPAVFPTVQGRLIAATRVIRLKENLTDKNPDPRFLLDTEARSHELVLRTVERFTMAGDFHVKDVTGESVMLTVQGKSATSIASKRFGAAVGELTRNGVIEIQSGDEKVWLLPATHTAENGFDLVVHIEQAPSVLESLIEAGALPVGHDALEILRIEAGIARHGRDMDETNVVTETNLDDAVSFTKGCYIGQEIIVRIKHRGHVAKKLTGLMFDSQKTLSSGAVIKSTDDKEIGRITSSTYSPQLAGTVALGYVRYEYLAIGTAVKVLTNEEEVNGTVHELPFVRGSWYTN